MAHASNIGYVKDGDITFTDETTTLEQAKTPSIISLGRLIQYGAKMLWLKDDAVLSLPCERRLRVPVVNNCPYADGEILEAVKDSNEEAKQKRKTRDYLAKLHRAFMVRISGQKEFDEHRR